MGCRSHTMSASEYFTRWEASTVSNEAASERFNWRLPLYTALATIGVGVLDAVAESDGAVYFLLGVIVSLFLLAFLLSAAVGNRTGRCISILSVLVIYLILSFALFRNHYAIRNTARWALWSHRYKAEVLAQSAPVNKEMKHIEWDGWAFPGAGDTTLISSSTQPIRLL